VKDGELLAQGEVFQGKLRTILEKGAEKDEEDPEDGHGQPPEAMLPEVLRRKAGVSDRTAANARKQGRTSFRKGQGANIKERC
jgi:hypothetical protein